MACEPSLGIVLRYQLGLRSHRLGELRLQRLGHLLVHLLAGALEQRRIGRILDQGMLEAIGGARRSAPLIEQLRCHQLLQPCLKGSFVQGRQGLDQGMRKLPAQHCPELGHSFRRRQAIQASHQ